MLGWAEFCGLRVAVAPGVFVPRRRTELLVRVAAARTPPGAVVLDLCCGTGAVGLALLHGTAAGELHAADLDPAAVACARLNLAPVGGRVHEGDMYAALPGSLRGRVDVLVANAPYVPTGALGLLPREARLHEPVHALDGGGDGLDVHRRIAASAQAWLAPGGVLLAETSTAQAERHAALLAEHGLAVEVVASEPDDAAVVVGVAPSARPPAAV